MTASDWLVLLGYAVVATAAGGLLLRRLGRADDPLVTNWGACFLCGQLVMTLVVLTTAFAPWRLSQLGPPFVGAVAVSAAGELVVAVRRGHGPDVLRRGAAELGLLLLALCLFPGLVFLVHHVPPIEWDARSIWFFHGRSLAEAGRVDAAFFTDPLLWWSHPDYPLHLPAQSAWIAWMRGGWSEVAVRSFLLINFAAMFRLALAVLAASRGRRWLALPLTVVMMTQSGPSMVTSEAWVSGQADAHYVGPLVLALLVAAAVPPVRSAPLVVLLLSVAASVKNEGTVYVALLVLALAARRAQGWWRRRRQGAAPDLAAWWRAQRRLVVFGALVGGLPLLLWSVFKAANGIHNDLGLGAKLMDPAGVLEAIAARSGTIVGWFGELGLRNGTDVLLLAWVGLAVASLAIASTGADARPRRHEWRTALALVVTTVLIWFAYVLTPRDLEWHLSTSAGRLLLLPHLLVFALCVFRLDACVPSWASPAPGRPPAGRSGWLARSP